MPSRLRLVLHPLTGAFPVFGFRGRVWDVWAAVTVWSLLSPASSAYPAAGSHVNVILSPEEPGGQFPSGCPAALPHQRRAPIPSSRALDARVTAHLPGGHRSSGCQGVSQWLGFAVPQ